jgi:nucleoside-diphosphate-sugar epimerase
VKVLVTGGAGFVGRYVVRELVRRGHDVTALTRRPPGASRPATRGVRFLHGDLRRMSDEMAGEIAAHDAIVHLAAALSGTPRARFEGTVLATERLLDALTRAGWRGRFVHVSSIAVYGFNQVPPRGVLDESTGLEPELGRRDDYAWTKTWQERVVQGFADGGQAEVVIVRPGSIYGPERPFQHRLGRMVGGRVLVLIGGLTPMPLSYVENTASLLATCAEHPRATGEIFNAVDPDCPSQWRYLRHVRPRLPTMVVLRVPLMAYRAACVAYERLERATGGAIEGPGFFSRYVMCPSFEPYRYSTDKPGRVLGWRPPVDARAGMARVAVGNRH